MTRDTLIPLGEAKSKLYEIVRSLEDHNAVLLRHGRPVAVLIAPDRLERLLDLVEDLEDRLAAREADEEPADVRVPWDKLKAEAGLLGR